MKEKLIIAIDPGFSDYKIVINGSLFTFSSKMLDVTDAVYGADRRPAGSYYVRLEKETLKDSAEEKETLKGRVKDLEYLIGNVTETSMGSADIVKKNRHLLEILQTLSKFPTEEFKISLQGALALALFQYQQSDENTNGFTIERLNNDEYEVYLGIALPQDYVAQKGVIQPHLSCKHNFKLYVADQNLEIPITYDLSEAKYMADSQVKCAFLYQFTDDLGNDVEDFWDNLPCFVVDGGYHTFGMFYLTKDLATPVCESNLEYAMFTVDTNVATEVTTKINRTNFSAVQVKEYLKNKQSIKYGTKRLEYQELQEIYDQKRRAVASNSIKAMVKLVEMDDCNSLLLTGGTGAAYYDVYEEYFAENYGDNLVPILTDKPFNGKKIDPVFAVALGLYKQMLSAVEANSAA